MRKKKKKFREQWKVRLPTFHVHEEGDYYGIIHMRLAIHDAKTGKIIKKTKERRGDI